ncbi:Uncharacterized protein Fot_26394 [Forsythia ovata]|uniref:Uncharacterized protein n=1 Tax=Forsythia ovata TaxID=205694 RepID=A0ABD1UBW2_9LAMI
MNEKRCKRRRELYAERNQWRCDGRRSTRFAVENAMYMSAYEISESNEVDGIDVECSENIREEYGEQAGFDEIEMVGQIFERQYEGLWSIIEGQNIYAKVLALFYLIMAGNYKLISQISPGQTNWTAKVVVAEKSVPKIGQHSLTKYQNIVLIDLKVFLP